jgi:DNA-binding beta-propeller fold protein YncE
MFFRHHKVLFIFLLWLQQINGALHIYANEVLINPTPVTIVTNPCPLYSLINSVDFHPKKNLFCVTYTHGNRVVIYKIDAVGKSEMVQSLSNPIANLSEPQHAAFSPDGKKIVVANWTNQTLTIYQCEENGFFCAIPIAIIPSLSQFTHHRPHGITFSPCGKYLAIAYGATSQCGRAVALFRIKEEGTDIELVDALQGVEELPGIPKGITFTPDGNCLLVTFSDTNSLVIFDLARQDQTIIPIPKQVIQGQETKISRPEDVKISPDGNYCAITNSDQHTVTFYPFDKASNRIIQNTPSYVLQNSEARLCFPHGIAFSSDGSFVLITEFGPIHTTEEGGIFWDAAMQPDEAKVKIYKTIF